MMRVRRHPIFHALEGAFLPISIIQLGYWDHHFWRGFNLGGKNGTNITIVHCICIVCDGGYSMQRGQPVAGTMPPVSSNPPEGLQTATAAPTEPLKPTVTLTPTPTTAPTDTPTPLPTDTPTPLPSPTPDVLPIGFYQGGGCVVYHPSQILTFNFCVVSIEIRRDRTLEVAVSWDIDYHAVGWVYKRSDTGNRNMYLRDNLGNRYDHIGVGGDANRDAFINWQTETLFGTFLFPPAKPGVKFFEFHDGTNGVMVGDIMMVNPIIIREYQNLAFNPLEIEYLTKYWKVGAPTAAGGITLEHTTIPHCRIEEWPMGETTGKYKNTIDIGQITYKILGWADNENKWSVREYVAIGGLEGLPEGTEPQFHAYIPFTDGEMCLADISTALAHVMVLQ